jgi:hypothetical protein
MAEKRKNRRAKVQRPAVEKKPKTSLSVEPVPPVMVESKGPKSTAKTTEQGVKVTTKKPAVLTPTFERIQLKAYFISERRRALGIPGDEYQDWITAEQELRSELMSADKQ